MPKHFVLLSMPRAEKIKQVATALPHIVVPARAARPFRLIHSERRVTILAIREMFSKGTATHPTPINPDMAPDHRERVRHIILRSWYERAEVREVMPFLL